MSSILRHEKQAIYSHIIEQGLFTHDTFGNTDDLWHDFSYIGQGLYECIFVKNNRDINFVEKSRLDNL